MVNVGVDIKGRNSDLLRAVASSKVALASLREEQRRGNTVTREATQDGRQYERQLRNINRELGQQSRSLKILTGDFLAVRNAMRTLATQGAIAGLGNLASALGSVTTSASALAFSLTNVAAVAGTGFLSYLSAAVQGVGVFKLATQNLAAAITSAGKAHELALSKLTQPQRQFVREAAGLRNAYRQLQIVAQQGLFPGLIEAGKHISEKLMPALRTGVYDTSKAFGYLAERGVGMLNKRIPEFTRLMERNVITIERAGSSIENIVSGILDIFPTIEPLIGHVTKGVETFTAKFKDLMGSKSGKNQVKDAIESLRTSWDNWTSTIGAAGKALFHIWDATQPVVHKMEGAIKNVAKNAAVWTGSHKDDIRRYFDAGLKPLGAFARLLGDVVKDIGKLAFENDDRTARFFDSLRTQVLPVLVDLVTTISNDLGPKIGRLFLDVIHFVDVSLPGIKSLLSVFKPFADLLHDILTYASGIVSYFNQFGSVAGAIATLGVGAAVILGWKTLRTEVSLAIQALKYYGGVSLNAEKPTARAFVTALPGDRVVPAVARYARNPIENTGRGIGGAVARVRNFRDRNASPEFARYVAGNATTRIDSRGNIVPPTVISNPRAPFEGVGPRTRVTGGPINPLSGFYQMPSGGRVNTVERIHTPNGTRIRVPDSSLQYGDRGRYLGGFVRTSNSISGTLPSNQVAAIQKSMGGAQGIVARTVENGTSKGFVSGLKSAGARAAPIVKTVGATLAASFGLAYLLDSGTRKATNAQLTDRQTGPGGLPKLGLTDSLAKLPVISQAKGFASFLGLTDKSKEAKDRAQEVGSELDKLYKKAQKLGDTRGMVKIAQQARDAAKQFPQFGDAFSEFAKQVDKGAGNAADQIAKMAATGGQKLSQIKQVAADTSFEINQRFGPGTAKAKDALARNFGAAVRAIRTSMKQGVIATDTGVKEIRKLFRQELALYGITGRAATNYARTDGVSTTGGNDRAANTGVGGAARGGMWRLPGAVGPDSIPLDVNGRKVLAAPGEDVAIINRHQRRYIDEKLAADGGLSGVFKKVNRKHFAGGGWVTGDTDYKPAVGNALTRMAKKKGVRIFVQSGGRTPAEQQVLINKYGANNPGHPVAGLNGPHVQGIAADITPGRETFGDVAGEFGLGFTVPQESWHVQLLNGAKGAASAIAASIKRVKTKAGGALGQISQAVLDNVRKAANDQLGTFAGGADGTGKTSAGGQYSKSMLASLWRRYSHGTGDPNLMAAIALAESGGNPDAYNPSGATGLWQILGSILPGNLRNPVVNVKNAIAKLRSQGLGAWEAYTNGNYRQFMARGGFIEAAMGLLSHGATPPPRGTDPGAPDTSQAVPSPKAKHPAKKKKKKKKVRDIAGSRPTVGAGINRSQFKPSSAKPAKIRKSIRKLLNSKFKVDTFSATDIIDPITGERLDASQVMPALGFINSANDFVDILQGQLGDATDRAGMTDEQFVVELTDSDQFPDLSNYLKSQGIDPTDWMTKYGDTAEVVNDDVRTVQGVPIRGIKPFVDEITEQLSYHTTRFASPVQALMGGGIMGLLGYQKRTAEAIPADKAIQERRDKLAKIKAAVEATIELRKAQFRKLSKMGSKGYTWKEAVAHNQSIIKGWQRWKRDSVGETLTETRSANSEIDRLTDENTHLKHDKPKGQIYGNAAYQKQYAEWGRSKRELELLTGAGDVQSWAPQEGMGGGLAGRVLMTLTEWKDIKDQKTGILKDLTTAIPAEQLSIDQLNKQITDATGSKAAVAQLLKGNTDTTKPDTSLQDALNTQKLTDALTANIDWSVLKGFAGLVQGRKIGSFSSGGLVPETGMALVHKGEFINPAPDGPYRNGMNAARNLVAGGSTTEVHLHGELGALVKLIDARIDGRAASTSSSQLGRRTRVIKAAPGR